MPNYHSNDPRAVRTRQAFQQAFIELLKTKRYQSITVTDVAKHAGFARHTFYNHYETLDDLLSNLVDSVLDEFFVKLDKWGFNLDSHESELRVFSTFFSVWKDHEEIVHIIKNLDIDDLLIRRLKAYFTEFYFNRVILEIPSANEALANYMINFNAYTLLGILKPWFEDDMVYSPEAMAEFSILLTGSAQRRQAVEKFKHIIR